MSALDRIEEIVLSDEGERRLYNLTPLSETWGWGERIAEITVQTVVNLAVPFFVLRRSLRRKR